MSQLSLTEFENNQSPVLFRICRNAALTSLFWSEQDGRLQIWRVVVTTLHTFTDGSGGTLSVAENDATFPSIDGLVYSGTKLTFRAAQCSHQANNDGDNAADEHPNGFICLDPVKNRETSELKESAALMPKIIRMAPPTSRAIETDLFIISLSMIVDNGRTDWLVLCLGVLKGVRVLR